MAQANNDFFNSLISGPALTPSQIQTLKSETLTPTQTHLDQVIEGGWHDAILKESPTSSDPLGLGDSSWPGIRALLSGKSGKEPSSVYSSAHSAGRPREIDSRRAVGGAIRKPASEASPPATRPETPAVALDGKAIPKYLEFRGRSRHSPSGRSPRRPSRRPSKPSP